MSQLVRIFSRNTRRTIRKYALCNFAIGWKPKQVNLVGVSTKKYTELVERLNATFDKLLLAEKEKAEARSQLEKSQNDLEAIAKVASGFLNRIYDVEIPPDQYKPTFFRLIKDWEIAGARISALGKSTDLAPNIETCRKKAQEAHAAGDTAEAFRLLNEIDAEELENEERLLRQQRDVTAEIQQTRQSRIATKDAQIPLALASLRHQEAARLIAVRIDLSEEDPGRRFELLSSEFDGFYERGRDKGLNTDLQVAIEIAREALKKFTRERGPLDWAMTQNNLGNALSTLGERETGTKRLLEAVEAYSSALKEWTRERNPLNWAMTQNNLGNALLTLGERETSTKRLLEAVEAYRAALEERTRERVPLDWAMTQNNLGAALQTLGKRETGTQRLLEAVTAFRAALEERTRERVPLRWAATQNNLGNALQTLEKRQTNAPA